MYTVALMIEKYHLIINKNLIVDITSDIQINSGMGSSAACICSIIKAFNVLF